VSASVEELVFTTLFLRVPGKYEDEFKWVFTGVLPRLLIRHVEDSMVFSTYARRSNPHRKISGILRAVNSSQGRMPKHGVAAVASPAHMIDVFWRRFCRFQEWQALISG
jgi:hypothetical protein